MTEARRALQILLEADPKLPSKADWVSEQLQSLIVKVAVHCSWDAEDASSALLSLLLVRSMVRYGPDVVKQLIDSLTEELEAQAKSAIMQLSGETTDAEDNCQK